MTRYLILSLLLTAFALPAAHAEDPSSPTMPTAPTCAKKVSKQVMSGGALKTVMVDNASCLAQWTAYSAAFGGWPPGGDAASPTLGAMKWIPPGTFTMGSATSESGRGSDETQHSVTLTKGYWLMEHEVTQREWQVVMGSNPSLFAECGPTCPVENVSWKDAVEFAQKASARDGVTYTLPTEAQWEYAARGGRSGELYSGSNEATSVGWIDANSRSTTHAVCGKARNGYGLCDMSGNLWEWTSDGYGDYGGSTSDPMGASTGSDRVFRGGSWIDSAQNARVARRVRRDPAHCIYYLGFRLMRIGAVTATTKQAKIEYGTPDADVESGDGGAIPSIVHKKSAHFQRCVEAGLEQDESMTGRVSIGWSIIAGTVINVHKVENTTGNEAIDRCFATVIRSLKFDETLTAEVAAYTWSVSGTFEGDASGQ